MLQVLSFPKSPRSSNSDLPSKSYGHFRFSTYRKFLISTFIYYYKYKLSNLKFPENQTWNKVVSLLSYFYEISLPSICLDFIHSYYIHISKPSQFVSYLNWIQSYLTSLFLQIEFNYLIFSFHLFNSITLLNLI